jgi:threonyl-tRNA synthetase
MDSAANSPSTLPLASECSDRIETNSSVRATSSDGVEAESLPTCLAQICLPVVMLTRLTVPPSSSRYRLAAFYGPKIDLQVTDPQGREETLSTIQVDLLLPQRFGLKYQRDDIDQQPIMIHRSIIATMERMTAHLLEVHNGALPAWLSPTQVLVLPASDDSRLYARSIKDRLAANGLRTELDERDATLGARIRAAQQRKIPYLAVVGQREEQAQTISIRSRSGAQLGPVAIDEFIAMARRVITARDLDVVPT